MKILITNDDGIQSEGLQLLCRRLAEKHEVYVVAPDGQRSATSHCASFYKKLYAKKLENFHNATLAYSFTGTPADCVKFAESVLNKLGYDIGDNFMNTFGSEYTEEELTFYWTDEEYREFLEELKEFSK